MALTERIVETVAPQAWRASKVEVVVDVDVAVALPCAIVDPDRLEQVLRNLLHNGVRHTPPGGIVAVALSAKESTVVLQVKDTGEGIAPVDLPHLGTFLSQREHQYGPGPCLSERMDGGHGWIGGGGECTGGR